MPNKKAQIDSIKEVIVILIIVAVGLFMVLFSLDFLLGTGQFEDVLINSEFILANNGSAQTLSQTPVTLSATRLNDTWLNCTVDDSLTVTVSEDKTTISVWFANSTTDWTSLINSNNDIYINGSLDGSWTFLPYYITGDDIIFCKTDGSTFLNVSVDAIRVYGVELNSTQVLEVYNYGR